jgi:hypothetical protein
MLIVSTVIAVFHETVQHLLLQCTADALLCNYFENR